MVGIKRIYKDRIGYRISVTLEEDDGTAIDISSSTVTLELYSTGTNTRAWAHEMTVVVAADGTAYYDNVDGDFDTVGVYYSLVQIVYDGGDQRTVVGPSFDVIENEENLVTPSEFIEFIDIPPENAKSDNTIRSYLEAAESLIDREISSLANATNVDQLKLKKTVIKLKAGVLYFLNSDEGTVDPNIRNAKIEMWKKEYNEMAENLNETIASDSTSQGVFRKVRNSAYTDSTSYLYDADL